MKDTITINNQKRRTFKFYAILLSVLTLFLAGTLVYMFSYSKNTTIENIKAIDGKVTQITELEYEDQFSVKFEDGASYKINGIIGSELEKNEIFLLKDKIITIYLCPYGNEEVIVGIESSNINFSKETGFDLLKSNLVDSIVFLAILTSVIFVLAILFLILMLNQKKQTEKNIIEMYAINVVTSPKRRKANLYLIIPMLLLFFIGIPTIITLGNIDDTSTLFYSILAAFCILFLIWVALMFVFLPKLRKSDIKFSDEFFDFQPIFDESNVYNSFYVFNEECDLCFKFTEEGLLFETEILIENEIENMKAYANYQKTRKKDFNENEFIQVSTSEIRKSVEEMNLNDMLFKYKDLNFYTKVIYRPTGIVSAFVVSDISEENKQNLKNNIILQLNEELFYFINRYNIQVKGLKEFLDNRLDFMLENCKGKIKYISYKSDSF